MCQYPGEWATACGRNGVDHGFALGQYLWQRQPSSLGMYHPTRSISNEIEVHACDRGLNPTFLDRHIRETLTATSPESHPRKQWVNVFDNGLKREHFRIVKVTFVYCTPGQRSIPEELFGTSHSSRLISCMYLIELSQVN